MKFLITITVLLTLTTAVGQESYFKAYEGTWKGILEIFSPQGKVLHSVPMELHIAQTNGGRFTWKTVYDNKDIRDYELVTVDVAKGKYRIDEKNGILIDLSLFGNKSFTCFETGGYLIYDLYTFNKDSIIFELTSSAPGQETISGNGTEESPKVTSRIQVSYQKAVLKKQ
ncbi:hypothetical protein CHU92_08155 [Flavobacterium cyanobacteriorum]|uniref:Uncharacterized protein n=1 Tax=Flavobacterium cyanobacteriorum TaxID=2022802 RepID=A0A255Z802_9FLAO|nr:hypothetical protein [Flavobacterium cyanobacteriorum]OYQ37551.1 hypothetical protein CHU92_08155 [Flavobacterium cyanobacteriorum]